MVIWVAEAAWTFLHTHMQTCTDMHRHVYTCTHVYIHAYIHKFICIYIYTNHTYINTYVHEYIHICETIVFNLFLPVENSQFGALRGRARAAGTNGKEIGNVRTLHTARICRIHIHKFHAGDMLNSHVEKASGGCWCAAPDIDFSAEFFQRCSLDIQNN